jgi:hypothetical protein
MPSAVGAIGVAAASDGAAASGRDEVGVLPVSASMVTVVALS